MQCAALLTRFFKSFGDGGDDCPAVPLVGFSGLMLACLEDTGLAAAAAARQYSLNDLMTYSAVCGIGLDTVPIPGHTPVDKIAAEGTFHSILPCHTSFLCKYTLSTYA